MGCAFAGKSAGKAMGLLSAISASDQFFPLASLLTSYHDLDPLSPHFCHEASLENADMAIELRIGCGCCTKQEC